MVLYVIIQYRMRSLKLTEQVHQRTASSYNPGLDSAPVKFKENPTFEGLILWCPYIKYAASAAVNEAPSACSLTDTQLSIVSYKIAASVQCLTHQLRA